MSQINFKNKLILLIKINYNYNHKIIKINKMIKLRK